MINKLFPILLVIGSFSPLMAQLYTPGQSLNPVGNGSSTNVGVGVVNPGYQLDVSNELRIQGNQPKLVLGRTNDNFLPALYSYATSFANDNFNFAINNTGDGIFPTSTFSSARLRLFTSNSSANASILFETRPPSGSFSTKMLLTTDGNLGVGTTDVKAQLVVGDAFGAVVSGSSGGYATFGSNLANVNGTADMYTPYTHATFGYSGMRTNWGKIEFFTGQGSTVTGQTVSPSARMIIDSQGNVGIGTTSPGSFKLAVNGKIWAQEVNIALTNPGPDYVFEPDYDLMPLSEIESYIKANKHLPEVPSANQMQTDGLNVQEMNLLLLKKVEEMTLYLITMKKELIDQTEKNKQLEDRLKSLEANENK